MPLSQRCSLPPKLLIQSDGGMAASSDCIHITADGSSCSLFGMCDIRFPAVPGC